MTDRTLSIARRSFAILLGALALTCSSVDLAHAEWEYCLGRTCAETTDSGRYLGTLQVDISAAWSLEDHSGRYYVRVDGAGMDFTTEPVYVPDGGRFHENIELNRVFNVGDVICVTGFWERDRVSHAIGKPCLEIME
ncbi:hypothetical protein ACWIGW_39545 [Nocardia brasiliensis]